MSTLYDELKAHQNNKHDKRVFGLVLQGGGEVLGEPVEIPGVGMYVSFKDTEGNRVSLIQANNM